MDNSEKLFIIICVIISIIGVLKTVRAECNQICEIEDEKVTYVCSDKGGTCNLEGKDYIEYLNDESKSMEGGFLLDSFYEEPGTTEDWTNLSAGLKLYYPFCEDGAIDQSGNGFDGTVVGATWQSDTHDFRFDGINDVINVNFGTDLLNPNQTTHCFWLNYTYGNLGTFRDMHVAYTSKKNSDSEEVLRIHMNNRTSNAYKPGFVNDYSLSITSGTTINENTWHHICGVINVTTASGEIDMYLDGTYISKDTSLGAIPSINQTNLGAIGTVRWYNGTLDEIRVYNYSLTGQEILQLYNEGHTFQCSNITIEVPEPWHDYNETIGSYWINQTVSANNLLLEQIKGEFTMIGMIILWLGLWIFGYYCLQTNNDQLGYTMIILTVPIDLYFSYEFREVLHLGTGLVGIAFAVMTAWTFGIALFIKRLKKGSIAG